MRAKNSLFMRIRTRGHSGLRHFWSQVRKSRRWPCLLFWCTDRCSGVVWTPVDLLLPDHLSGPQPPPFPRDHGDGTVLPNRGTHWFVCGAPGSLMCIWPGWRESLKDVSLCPSLPALSRNAYVYPGCGPSCTKGQMLPPPPRVVHELPRTWPSIPPSPPSTKLTLGNAVSLLILSLFLLFLSLNVKIPSWFLQNHCACDREIQQRTAATRLGGTGWAPLSPTLTKNT